MAEIIAELDRILVEEQNTTDAQRREELRKEKEYLKNEYYGEYGK